MDFPNRRFLSLPIFALSLAFYLRLISKGPFTVDCLHLAEASQHFLRTGHFGFLFGFGYPLMVMLGAVFTKAGLIFGVSDNVLSVNLISAVFGATDVLLIYLLAGEFFDGITSLLCAIILCLNPIFVDVSTYGMSHTPTLCFLLFGLLILVRHHKTPNRHALFLSTLSFALMGACRLEDLVLHFPFISMAFWFAIEQNDRRLSRLLLHLAGIAAMTALAHAPYFLSFKSYISQLHLFWTSGLTSNFLGFFSWKAGYSFLYLVNDFTWAGMIAYAAGLACLYIFGPRILLWTILWWLIPFEFYGNTVTSAARFLTTILPALIVPMAFFISSVFQRPKTIFKGIAVLLLAAIIIFPMTGAAALFIRRHQADLMGDFYRWVGRITPSNAVIIAVDDAPLINYYAHRRTMPRPAAIDAHLSTKDLAEFKREIDAHLHDQTPVYITQPSLDNYDYFQEFHNLLKLNYRCTWVGFRPIELWYYTPFDPLVYVSGLAQIRALNR